MTKASSTKAGGTVSVPGRVDQGDVITVNVTPDAGYSLVANSLKAMITKKSGAEEVNELVDLIADENGAYRFTVPTDLGNDAVITILAKFTEGTVEQPKKALSLGVGVNVSYTKHSNNAYIKK